MFSCFFRLFYFSCSTCLIIIHESENWPLTRAEGNKLRVEGFTVIKSRRLRWAGHVARMEEGRSAFKNVTGKPTGKRPLERPRRRWEDNIRMDLEKIGINGGNWVDSAEDRNYWRALVNAALNLRVP